MKHRLYQSSQVEKAQAALTISRALYGEIPGQLKTGAKELKRIEDKFSKNDPTANADKLFPEDDAPEVLGGHLAEDATE